MNRQLDYIKHLTFSQIDIEKGFVPELSPVDTDVSASWEQWYTSIYKKPFQDLTNEDLSRISVQDWNPEYFVPLSLDRLRSAPFAGAYYDGQLLLNIGTTHIGFLQNNPQMLNEYCQILNNVLQRLNAEGEHLTEYECTVFDDGTTVFDDTHAELIDLQAMLSCR